jgi:hypothetical protein
MPGRRSLTVVGNCCELEEERNCAIAVPMQVASATQYPPALRHGPSLWTVMCVSMAPGQSRRLRCAPHRPASGRAPARVRGRPLRSTAPVHGCRHPSGAAQFPTTAAPGAGGADCYVGRHPSGNHQLGEVLRAQACEERRGSAEASRSPHRRARRNELAGSLVAGVRGNVYPDPHHPVAA